MDSNKTIINNIEKILALKNLALVVYSPDAFKSNLIPLLEAEIHKKTECVPVLRRWFKHSESSIEQFYANSIENNVPHWHLVSKLFLYGPSLATFWWGEDAQNKILQIKGRSHPAIAKQGTIRSKFWCDNPICNLIHVSDNEEEALREIKILNTLGCNFDLQKPNPLPLLNQVESPILCHNSLFTICKIVQRSLSISGINLNLPSIPSDGSARQMTNQSLAWIKKTTDETQNDLTEILKIFLYKEVGIQEFSTRIQRILPITNWEDLLIKCAVVSKEGWEYDDKI